MLDVRPWNLFLPAALAAAACGGITPGGGDDVSDSGNEGTGETGSGTETEGGTGTTTATDTDTDTDTGTDTGPECENDSDCAFDEYCVGGECECYGACGDGDGEHEYGPEDCYSLHECYELEICQSYTCGTIPQLDDCNPVPQLTQSIPLPNGADADGIHLAFVDANGDASRDLVLANDDGVQLVRGPGDQVSDLPPNGALTPAGLAVGRLDGDAHQDVVVLDADGGGTIHVLLGDGAGVFTAGAGGANAGPFGEAVIGDFDADGNTDVLVSTAAGLEIWEGDGQGALVAGDVLAAVPSSKLAAANIVDDAYLDVVGETATLRQAWWDMSLQTSTFVPDQSDGAEAADLLTGSLNGDAFPDVLRISIGNGWSALTAWPGQDGSIGPAEFLGLETEHRLIAIGDVDGDTNPDIVATGGGMSITIVFGDGGLFSGCVTNFITDHSATRLAVGDIDGDGRDEIAFRSGTQTSILGIE